MNPSIERIRKTRLYLIDQIKDLSIDQLNKIPEGFNNNIAWNFGHLIAAQQGITYKRAGRKTFVSELFFETYKPGTKPTRNIDSNGFEELKTLSASSLDRLEADYEGGNGFYYYTPWTTRYGVELANIDEAIAFLAFHEGYHAGCISVLKKLVSNNETDQ